MEGTQNKPRLVRVLKRKVRLRVLKKTQANYELMTIAPRPLPEWGDETAQYHQTRGVVSEVRVMHR